MRRALYFALPALAAAALAAGCSENRVIELPLTEKTGFGPFTLSYGASGINTDDRENPWYNLNLNPLSAPDGMTDVRYGSIETDIYQSVYQGYHSGQITPEFYRNLQAGWNWVPDTLILSKSPVRTRIAFAVGKDSAGRTVTAIDTDNDMDLADEETFIPAGTDKIYASENPDSAALANTVMVCVDKYADGRAEEITIPLSVAWREKQNYLFTNFPVYSETEYKGERIAVRPRQYRSFDNYGLELALFRDADTSGKVSFGHTYKAGDILDIGGDLLMIKGVDTADNTLKLEKMNAPAEEIYAAQKGFLAKPFAGREFTSGREIRLEDFRGKYVLLDFWALGCPPCIHEFPILKELYQKTGRDDFEIIGIICPGDSQLIEKTIASSGLPWPQVMADSDESNINTSYGIYYYPTTFLIGPDGVILEKDIRGRDIETKVLSLIGENED